MINQINNLKGIIAKNKVAKTIVNAAYEIRKELGPFTKPYLSMNLGANTVFLHAGRLSAGKLEK